MSIRAVFAAAHLIRLDPVTAVVAITPFDLLDSSTKRLHADPFSPHESDKSVAHF
jgi:hypothetical protein